MNNDVRELVKAWKQYDREQERRAEIRHQELRQHQRLVREGVRLEARQGQWPTAIQKRMLIELDLLQRRQCRDLDERIAAEQLAENKVDIRWSIDVPAISASTGPINRRPGRPKRSQPEDLKAALKLRGELTRQLQVEKNQSPGNYSFEAAVRAAAIQHLSDQGSAIATLLESVEEAGWRPSDAAARIAALKYGIAVNRVRRGPNPVPRIRTTRRRLLGVGNIDR